MRRPGISAALALVLLAFAARALAAEPLPSWNDGPAKQAILRFVADVSTPGSPAFVPVDERIAVFDNDGTLWSEQPMYVQLAFAIDRVKALAPSHPEWRGTMPFQAALDGDLAALAAMGERGLLELVLATHSGMTTDEFAAIVRDWARTARHPTLGRRFVELTYVPMRELIGLLRENGFAVWIVSGGGVEFVRAISTELYGIPPERVIGSSVRTKYELRGGKPVIVRLPEIDFIDDKAGKPVGIQAAIGRRPIAAFGNSDGDFEMLEWTTAAPGARLGLIVRHDDAAREFAYDRRSAFGRLDRALDEAPRRGWVVVGMKDDWRSVFAPAR